MFNFVISLLVCLFVCLFILTSFIGIGERSILNVRFDDSNELPLNIWSHQYRIGFNWKSNCAGIAWTVDGTIRNDIGMPENGEK